MRRVWIDTDPGLDDAVAIALLATTCSWEIVALSAVGGNTCLPIVSQNLVNIARHLDLKAPIFKGLDRENRYMITSHPGLKNQGRLGARPTAAHKPDPSCDQERSSVGGEGLDQLIPVSYTHL